MINYFRYDYAGRRRGERRPFSRHDRGRAPCPWNAEHRLALDRPAGARRSTRTELPRAQPRLPARRLGLDGSRPTSCRCVKHGAADARRHAAARGPRRDRRLRRRQRARAAVDRGAHKDDDPPGASSGSKPAARPTAARASRSPTRSRSEHFVKGGINRVILATDGDFNVGVTSEGELDRLIEEKREERRVPVRARLRHRQPQGLDDGEAGRQGQRQLRLHRLAARSAQGARRAKRAPRSSRSRRT